MNQKWQNDVSGIATVYLKYAIETRDSRNRLRKSGDFEISEKVDGFMKRWARDFSITVRQWKLNPRTGGVK